MDPCIVDYSGEIPTRRRFVIEFIIPKFFKAQYVSSGTALIIRSFFFIFNQLYNPWWVLAWSSGALNCTCSLWFICPHGERPLPFSLGKGRSPYGHINQRLQIKFRATGDERCAARNMLSLNTLRTGSFKLFKRPFPGLLTILTL